MKTDIEYTIRFFSDWHCGSGLAAGADIDMLTIKGKNKLPFIPGKTIKGLVREAVEAIFSFEQRQKDKDFYEAFGYNNDEDSEDTGNDKIVEGINDLQNNGVGCCIFSNAVLNETLQKKILNPGGNNFVRFLYRSQSSTSIDESGIAKKHHLRQMETVIPCELNGTIRNVPVSGKEYIERGLKLIKRLGVNRNRGLGRCQIIINPQVS